MSVRICRCRVAKRLRKKCNVQASQLERYTFGTYNVAECRPYKGLTQKQAVARMGEVVKACRGYAESPSGWLVLLGKVGSGKSHLAYAIAGRMLDRGVGVYWDTVPELLDHLRNGYKDNSYMDLLQSMMRVPALVLDDLGAEQETSWVTEKLFQLLNRRYMDRRPTVITSNLNIRDEDVKLDARLRSRMLDRRLSQVLTLAAADFRMEVAA
jgi:DNA replication protein DnaC